ncbi:MAG: hypothetical protein R3A46_12680 [Thermomicrobiales bacterium]
MRVITYYGVDNQIDGIVLDVLLRKHKSIRSSLGISVPVPGDTNQVVEAIFEGLLLRERSSSAGTAQYLPGFEEMLSPCAAAAADRLGRGGRARSVARRRCSCPGPDQR